MSSAEPFMPAHEPAAPVPPGEHDIDHDTDVIFDQGEGDAADADPQPWHSSDAPAVPRPVPGAHLTTEQLAADFAADDEPDAVPE